MADADAKKVEKPAQSYAAAGGVVALINDKARKHAYGFIKLKIFFDKEKSQLVAQVVEARDLQGPKCSPYVKAYLMPDKKKDTKEKTSAKKNQLNPHWGGEELRWNMPKLNEYNDRMLEITMWDKESLSKNDFRGRTAFPVAKLVPPHPPVEGWFELFDGDKGKAEFHQLQPQGDSSKYFKALYDYEPRCKQELLLRMEDLLVPVHEDRDWVLVENVLTGSQGMVPKSFIASAWSLDSEPWYFGPITRAKAETLLMNPLRKHGCFLIRESESQKGQYSLSMRDGDAVRHFRVQTLDDGKYRLNGSSSQPFDNLSDLVAFHKIKKSGLTTTLKEACPKPQAVATNDLSYETRDKWEVPRDEIELVGLLGQGQYGEVYRGTWKGEIPVAVKTLKTETSSSAEFLAEAAIMKKLKHRNLIQLYAVCTVGMPIYIVTELMSHGCLLDYLRTPAGEQLRLPTLINMGANIAAGMAYLEENNFVHRDLAARNILVGDENLCKVADFGFARLLEADQDTIDVDSKTEKFPVRWTAPEAMTQSAYTIKSDVWSFGILLTEIITYGKKPYQGLTNKEVVQQLEKGYRMPQMPGCPDALYKIMFECWKTDPLERPTFHSLVFRLEDFFSSGEANYTEVNRLIADD